MPAALVTGAAKRLGREMAICLARNGFDVAVHYATSMSDAEEVAEEIRAIGRSAVTLQADLLCEEQTQALLPRAMEALGQPITCLINNASIFEYDLIETATRESWDRHLESNLRAPFVLTQVLAAQLPELTVDQSGEPLSAGLVINMIDQRVRKLTPEFMSYTIAKAGLWAFTQTAAQGLAPKVRVNAIGPGPTLQGELQSNEQFSTQRKSTILERGANASDILAALEFFLKSPAVTGQLICVDGGQHLAWITPDVFGLESPKPKVVHRSQHFNI